MKLMKTICLAALAVVSGPAVRAAESSANTWAEAAVDFHRTLKNYLGDRKGRWSTTDGYGDSVYRAGTGHVLIRTGIDSKALGLSPGFYTNTTIEWDLNSDTARVVEVANWAGGSYGNGKPLPAYRDHPTPTPRHTYDAICYVPEEDAMYMLFGAYIRMKGQKATDEAKRLIDDDVNHTWKFSFEKKRWSRIGGSPRTLETLRFRGSLVYESHLAYWPQGRRLLFVASGGGQHAEFDLKEQKWTAVPVRNSPDMSLYHARSAWDTKRDLWIFRKGPKVCTFDPREKRYERLPNCSDYPVPSAGDIGKMNAGKTKRDRRLEWKGICYISKHDRYLVSGPSGNDTAVYDPEAGVWTAIKGGDIKLPNGYAQYNPALDIVAMNYQLQCFKFKYVP